MSKPLDKFTICILIRNKVTAQFFQCPKDGPVFLTFYQETLAMYLIHNRP